MRVLTAALFLSLTACITTQVPRGCPTACGDGQICDASIGECKVDPCNGACHTGQTCKAGPPAKCVDLNVDEVRTIGPQEQGAIEEPPSPIHP